MEAKKHPKLSVTKMLHFCYTFVTLLLHFCYTFVTLLLHFRSFWKDLTIKIEPKRCTVVQNRGYHCFLKNTHWGLTGRSLDAHWTLTGRSLDAHWTLTGRSLDIFSCQKDAAAPKHPALPSGAPNRRKNDDTVLQK